MTWNTFGPQTSPIPLAYLDQNFDALRASTPQWGGVASGTTDALSISPDPAFTSYSPGMALQFVASQANATASPSLQVNGLAFTQIVSGNGAAIVPGSITAGSLISVVYYNGNFYLVGSVSGGAAGFRAGVQNVATTTSLSTAYLGFYIGLTGAGSFTLTLPPPANSVKGTLEIVNAAGAAVTLSTPTGVFSGPNSSGASTYSLATASSVVMTCDGVNWVFVSGSVTSGAPSIPDGSLTKPKFAPGVLGNRGAVTSVTGATTLTTAQLGTFVECTGGSYTVNVPTAVGQGSNLYEIYNAGSGVITLASAGGSFNGYFGTATTSMTLEAGASVVITSDNTNWIASTGSVQAGLLAQDRLKAGVLGNRGNVTLVSGAGTLAATALGTFVNASGTSYTLNVPTPVGNGGKELSVFVSASGTVTLSTPSGTFSGPFGSAASTLALPTTTTVVVTSDGTNWVANQGSSFSGTIPDGSLTKPKFAPGVLGNRGAFNSYSVNTTLTTAQFGQFIELTGSTNRTFTLPTPVGNGSSEFEFFNAGTATLTLSTPAGTFSGPYGSAASTMTVAAGQSLITTSDGANWVAVLGSNAIKPNTLIVLTGTPVTLSVANLDNIYQVVAGSDVTLPSVSSAAAAGKVLRFIGTEGYNNLATVRAVGTDIFYGPPKGNQYVHPQANGKNAYGYGSNTMLLGTYNVTMTPMVGPTQGYWNITLDTVPQQSLDQLNFISGALGNYNPIGSGAVTASRTLTANEYGSYLYTDAGVSADVTLDLPVPANVGSRNEKNPYFRICNWQNGGSGPNNILVTASTTPLTFRGPGTLYGGLGPTITIAPGTAYDFVGDVNVYYVFKIS